ncbi:beta-caryophyllene synthase [Tanacetum coccineum]
MSYDLFFYSSSDDEDEVNSELAFFTLACSAAIESSKPKRTRNQVERDSNSAYDRLVAAYFSAHSRYDEATFRTRGNGIDVVVRVESIRAIRDRFANTAYGFFLGKWVAYPIVANYDAMLENGLWFIRNNHLILKKWHPDENLLKEDVSTIPVWVKLHGVPVMAFRDDGLSAIPTKLGRSSYARVMIELQADVELKDNIVMAMPRIKGEGYYTCNIRKIGAGVTKNLKKTSQTPKEILVGQKMGSKPKQVLTLVDNDVDLGTNGGISNSADKGTNNVSSSNTPIGVKIDKIERQICEGKLRFVDDNGNPLVPSVIMENDSEVESDSYPDNDDYDPYNDDMYENHDMFEHLQSICDDLDITIHGRKK